MDIKTLRAVFTGGSYCKTRPLTRQDYGIRLQFVHADLDQYGTYQVHFSNVKDNNGTAKTQIADADGVVIPDEYLVTGKTVYAWAFVQSEGAGRTRCMVEIPVAEKPTVTPEEPTPQQRSAIDEAIDALNTGVTRAETAADNAERIERELPDTIADALREAKESGEFDGEDGKDGANGVTYTPAVDADGNISWTNDGGLPNPEPRNIKGPAGKDGKDGEVGATPNLTIGTVETLEPGTDATAEITGTPENPVLNLGIPQGEQGEGADTSNYAPVIINSASGAIASFADGADHMPIKALTVNVEPVQDLHGYDNPWPAGGGVNVVDFAAYFTEGETVTQNGITAVFSKGYLRVTGTNTSTTFNIVYKNSLVTLPAGTYIMPNGLNVRASVDGASKINYANVITAESSVEISNFYVFAGTGATVDYNIPMMLVKGTTRPAEYSPYSNICPIIGHESVTVTRTGKNLWSFDSSYSPSGYQIILNMVPFALKAGTYTFSAVPNIESDSIVLFGYHADGTRMEIARLLASTTRKSATATISKDVVSLYFVSNQAGTISDIQLELGTEATPYEPYQCDIYDITFPSEAGTVYGGTLDVTGGKMVVDRAMVDLGTLNWNKINTVAHHWRFWAYLNDMAVGGEMLSSQYKHITASQSYIGEIGIASQTSGSNYLAMVSDERFSDAATFKAAMSGVQLVYELATPIEITLTPTQINTLLGQNNIWSDAGEVDVDYRADTKLYIDNIHTPTEDDMTADAQIASGKYFLIGGTLYLSTTVIPAGDTIIPGTNCTKTNLADALNALNA